MVRFHFADTVVNVEIYFITVSKFIKIQGELINMIYDVYFKKKK